MLDYKLLEAFAEIVSAGGFDRAARRLHLTQSAVSQRVKSLEEQYGQVLLKRTSPPEPTEAGTILLTHYRQVRQLEDDLVLRRGGDSKYFTTIAIGVNEDSLATWFLPAVDELLQKEKIILDIQVDDQDNTHELLQHGKVRACISTKRTPLQGCRASYLGAMRYRLCASKSFIARWFVDGFNEQACVTAPMARFSRKDELNSRIFRQLFGRSFDSQPTFFLPSVEKYAEFISRGHCYGVLPELQICNLAENDGIVSLSPDGVIDVPLYYHCWTLKSEKMARFDEEVIGKARTLLAQ